MFGIHAQVSAGVTYYVISWDASFPMLVGYSMRPLTNAVQTELSVAVLVFGPCPKPAAAAATSFSKESFESLLVHSI